MVNWSARGIGQVSIAAGYAGNTDDDLELDVRGQFGVPVEIRLASSPDVLVGGLDTVGVHVGPRRAH